MSDIAVPAAPGAAAADPPIPWLGLIAVLMGTFISTLTGRLSVFGLADIRGAIHAGFDEGAWITTAQTVAQMLVTPIAVWVGGMFGPRRPLMWAAAVFAAVSLLEPFSPNLPILLAMQALGGLASGWFIPLTLGFILRNTSPKFWAYGVALYALNLELSLNISASFEGFYVDHLSWRWIFWQNVPLALVMALCLYFTKASVQPNLAGRRPDLFGLASCGVGLAAIYAALDQGNRLDWLNSGLICGLLLAGAILLAGFYLHERRAPNAFIDLKVLFANPLPRLLALISFLRLTILSTAYLIPLYLGAVRGYRALEVGQTLIWIAAPQFLVCFLVALFLRRFDPRILASLGFTLIILACLQVAHGLTPLWGSDQFLVSQLMQAMGQTFALSGIVFSAVLNMRPQDALSFGGGLQVARMMGGEIGTAFVTTLARVRGQVASNQIGQHVQVGAADVIHRIGAYAAATSRADTGPAAATHRGVAILAATVRQSAITQGVIDSFVTIAVMSTVALILLVTLAQAPQGPASHRPLFTGRRPAAP
jgi:DHA2 family multidrug resistance protein